MNYKIPVTWSVYAVMDIEAKSLAEAKRIANDAPLPHNGEYLDGSFVIDEDAVFDHNREILTKHD